MSIRKKRSGQVALIIVLMVVLLLSGIKSGFAKQLTICFPSNLPPWTLQKNDSGITIEIVRKSLKNRGYDLKTRYLTLKYLNQPVDSEVDANAQVESKDLPGFYSDQLLEFQTSLISLKPQNFSVHSVHDLIEKRIIAFQNASILFGDEFQNMANNNPYYREVVNQESQVVLLYQGKVDLILMDRNIFLYFRSVTSQANTSMPITYHQVNGLTEKSPTFVVFNSKQIRDHFNAGLKQLIESGEYYDIFYKYTR